MLFEAEQYLLFEYPLCRCSCVRSEQAFVGVAREEHRPKASSRALANASPMSPFLRTDTPTLEKSEQTLGEIFVLDEVFVRYLIRVRAELPVAELIRLKWAYKLVYCTHFDPTIMPGYVYDIR